MLKLLIRRGRVGASELEELKLSPEGALELLEGLPVALHDGELVAEDRVSLLLSSWRRGFNPLNLALKVGWRDFEQLCARIVEESGYVVFTNLRFRGGRRVYEVDVVGLKRPRILLLDCKRWHRFRGGRVRRAAQMQLERCRALADILPIEQRLSPLLLKEGWDEARVIPVVISLHEGPFRVHESIPIVPLRLLCPFLYELESYEDEVSVIRVQLQPSPLPKRLS